MIQNKQIEDLMERCDKAMEENMKLTEEYESLQKNEEKRKIYETEFKREKYTSDNQEIALF